MGSLTEDQLDQYRRDGFTVIRQAVDESAMARFDEAIRHHDLNDPVATIGSGRWPEPGRYTLARNAPADPVLAEFVSRPEITEPMSAVLDDDPKLMMFAYYDRTPGGPGLGQHHDYKRWRPIGSSMRWAFAIVALSDWDEQQGPLEVAAGSHRVTHRQVPGMPVWTADRPTPPSEADFVDPKIRRGDLAIVDMHCWHRAGDNRSPHHRIGLFTKWAAASAPPATGWYLFDESVRQAMGPDRDHVIAAASPLRVLTTRAIIERTTHDGSSRYLLVEDGDRVRFPGGPAGYEGAIPDWDDGNYIASLQDGLAHEIRTRTPWATYVGDYEEGEGLTRLYGYRLPPEAWGVQGPNLRWVSHQELAETLKTGGFGYECRSVEDWHDHTVMRGKGVTEALARSDQFAC